MARPTTRTGRFAGMPVVAVECANLFHVEIEGTGPCTVLTERTVADRAELKSLLARRVEIHGRCYCGHTTMVNAHNAILVDEPG